MAAKKAKKAKAAKRGAAKRRRAPMRAAERRKAKVKAPSRPRWEVRVEFRAKGCHATELDSVIEKAAGRTRVGSGYNFETATRDHFYPVAGRKAAVELELRLLDAMVAERRMLDIEVCIIRRVG